MTTQTARFALAAIAISVFVLTVGAIIWSAGSTLGYDFQAYEAAARRLLDGLRLYDPAVEAAGGFAIYLYPPPFALAIVPLAIVGGDAAIWIWTGLLIAAFLASVALLPVGRTVRWLILLLGALDWPLLYSLKLGQVGPILFLLFAIGWRWLDRPRLLGSTIGLGALIKIQPGLLVAWAALTGRWGACLVALAVVLGGAVAITVAAGTQPWFDYPALLGRVAAPLTTPHNFTPGAIAWQVGASPEVAAVIQAIAIATAVAAIVAAVRLTTKEASYLVTVVGSQLISPVLWDHYALLLLLPVAWLLQRRQWWAVAIPLATSIVLTGIAPPATYPAVFGLALAGLLVVGRTERLRRGQDRTGHAATVDAVRPTG